MLDWSSCPAVERDPDRVSGAWVFRGTRVPVKALFENLESGARIDDFLSWFPGVSVSRGLYRNVGSRAGAAHRSDQDKSDDYGRGVVDVPDCCAFSWRNSGAISAPFSHTRVWNSG